MPISFDEFKAREIEDKRERRKIAKKIAIIGKKIAGAITMKLIKLTPKDKLEIEICEGGCILTIKERGNTGPLNVKKRSIASSIERLCEILSKYEM